MGPAILCPPAWIVGGALTKRALVVAWSAYHRACAAVQCGPAPSRASSSSPAPARPSSPLLSPPQGLHPAKRNKACSGWRHSSVGQRFVACAYTNSRRRVRACWCRRHGSAARRHALVSSAQCSSAEAHACVISPAQQRRGARLCHCPSPAAQRNALVSSAQRSSDEALARAYGNSRVRACSCHRRSSAGHGVGLCPPQQSASRQHVRGSLA